MSWTLDLLNSFIKGIKDMTEPATSQLSDCGAQREVLVSAAENIVAGTSYQRSCETLEALCDGSYEKMSRGALQSCWPRMFTDACIVRSLAQASRSSSDAREAVARLDRAIIIAGAAGEGRRDLIHSLISRIQSDFIPAPNHEPKILNSKRQVPTPITLQASFHAISCLDAAPSFLTFQTHSHRQPFVLRKYAADWPAINDHPWASVVYLRSVAGPARVVPVEVGKDYRTDSWTQKLMGWDDFLSTLELDGQTTSTQSDVLYLAQHNLFLQFPDLNGDIVIPDYVYTCPPPPLDFPHYKPPGNDEQLVISSWLGPGGTISPAHTDPYYNMYVQVVGRKTIWLAPPAASEYMYPCHVQQAKNPASNMTNPSMSNTSQVDVFIENSQSRDLYPDFWKHVVPRAIHATLEPGDLLFMPPGWWHAMRAEETSFSVSMWF